jgi:DNA-binding GntR family transcriptional regulator
VPVAQHAGKFGPYVVGETSRLLVPSQHKRSRKLQIFGGLAGAELVRCRIALEVRLEDLSPGDRLPDAGVISQALGVSEITVRRTLETMDQDGLLERRRGRAGGTFIAERWDSVVAAMRNDHQAVQLVEFQLVLECGLAARACGELSPDDLAELGRHIQSTQAKRDRDAYALADARFHLSLAMVLGGWEARERQTDLLGKLCLLLPKPPMDVAAEQSQAHLLLLTGLENGSVETAIEALKLHAHCWPPSKVS